jgi:hypothetical protein
MPAINDVKDTLITSTLSVVFFDSKQDMQNTLLHIELTKTYKLYLCDIGILLFIDYKDREVNDKEIESIPFVITLNC